MAGGKSSCMGTNKALLPVGRETLLVRVVKLLKSLFLEIMVLTNEPALYQHLGMKLAKDLIPSTGPSEVFMLAWWPLLTDIILY